MSSINITYDELLSTLKRTSIKTVVVEGKDDEELYKILESHYDNYDFSYIKAGCRNSVLKLSKETTLNNSNVAFLVDQDTNLILETTNELTDLNDKIVVTEGYSIENDILIGSIDIITKLINDDEKMEIQNHIRNLAHWFTFQIYQDMPKLDDHINNTIIGKTNYEISELYSIGNDENSILDKVESNPYKYIRGKNLLEVYQHITNKPKRCTKYNKKALLDLCVRLNDNNIVIEQVLKNLEAVF